MQNSNDLILTDVHHALEEFVYGCGLLSTQRADGRERGVEHAERVKVAALPEDDGAVCAEGLLKVQVCAGHPAVHAPMDVLGPDGLETGGKR